MGPPKNPPPVSAETDDVEAIEPRPRLIMWGIKAWERYSMPPQVYIQYGIIVVRLNTHDADGLRA
jgi:hypothetical protein